MAKGVNPFAGRRHDNSGTISSALGGLTMTAETPGLDEMIERIQKYAKIGSTDVKLVRAGMSKITKLAEQRIASNTPYRTGKLKETLFSHVYPWPEGNVSGIAGLGTQKLEYNGKWAGLVPFVLEAGRKANARGRMAIKPMRFMKRSLDEVSSRVQAIWVQVANQITDYLAGKGG